MIIIDPRIKPEIRIIQSESDSTSTTEIDFTHVHYTIGETDKTPYWSLAFANLILFLPFVALQCYTGVNSALFPPLTILAITLSLSIFALYKVYTTKPMSWPTTSGKIYEATLRPGPLPTYHMGRSLTCYQQSERLAGNEAMTIFARCFFERIPQDKIPQMNLKEIVSLIRELKTLYPLIDASSYSSTKEFCFNLLNRAQDRLLQLLKIIENKELLWNFVPSDAFYLSLIENGVPEALAQEITVEMEKNIFAKRPKLTEAMILLSYFEAIKPHIEYTRTHANASQIADLIALGAIS